MYVDLNGMHACYVDDSPDANDVYSNNKCITSTGQLFHTHCDPDNLNATMDVSANNQYFTADGTAKINCGKETWDLKEWQAKGYDVGSSVSALPSAAQIVAWGEALLGLNASSR